MRAALFIFLFSFSLYDGCFTILSPVRLFKKTAPHIVKEVIPKFKEQKYSNGSYFRTVTKKTSHQPSPEGT